MSPGFSQELVLNLAMCWRRLKELPSPAEFGLQCTAYQLCKDMLSRCRPRRDGVSLRNPFVVLNSRTSNHNRHIRAYVSCLRVHVCLFPYVFTSCICIECVCMYVCSYVCVHVCAYV